MGEAYDCRQNHRCRSQPQRHLGKPFNLFALFCLPRLPLSDLAYWQDWAGGLPAYRSSQTEIMPREPFLSSQLTPRVTIWEENGLQVL